MTGNEQNIEALIRPYKKILHKFLTKFGMALMLLFTEIGALLLISPMTTGGFAAFEDSGSFENTIWFIAILLGFTLILLILIRYNMKWVMTTLIWASLLCAYIYVFTGLFILTGIENFDLLFILGTIAAIIAIVLLYKYPEWYIVDCLGVLLAAGIASMFGISLEPLPVIVLLILLAVYDAVSVYRTEHMLTLADGIINNRLPIMVIIPKNEGYSFIRDGVGGSIKNSTAEAYKPETKERTAYLMGLGDLIMPTILVVSAAVFLPGNGMGLLNFPAIGAIIGSFVGYYLLSKLMTGGKAQAGLPPLNGGAISGFVIGYLLTVI